MRLITRSNFDGLACAVLLKANGLVTDYVFVHPKDMQDGHIEVSANDILANVPYVSGCGMWFDHHSSEKQRVGSLDFMGSLKLASSCARVVWDYFGGSAKFSSALNPMLDTVDRFGTADLTLEEVLHPTEWVLLGMIMDSRTGLGRYRDYRISNYQLMRKMVDYCGTMNAEDILAEPDVQERVSRYFAQQESFSSMIERCSQVRGNVLVVDLRHEPELFVGNRFIAYALYPQCNVRVQVLWGKNRQNVVISVGHSFLNRTNTVDLSELMLRHGGGGHRHAAACQIPEEELETTLADIVHALEQN